MLIWPLQINIIAIDFELRVGVRWFTIRGWRETQVGAALVLALSFYYRH